MDKNNIIGLLLILLIFGGSVYFMKPSEDEIKKEQKLQDSLKRDREGLPLIKDSIVLGEPNKKVAIDSTVLSKPFGARSYGEEELVTLENEFIIAKVSTKGGRIKSVQVKGKTTFKGDSLVLFDGDLNKFGLEFNVPGKAVLTNDLYFEPIGGNTFVKGDQSKSVTMRLKQSDNQYIDYVYTIRGNSYNIRLDVNTEKLGSLLDVNAKQVRLNWETRLTQKEKNLSSERERSTVYYSDNEGNVDYLSTSKNDEKEFDKNLNWVAFKQHYFSNILLSKSGLSKSYISVKTADDDITIKDCIMSSELNVKDATHSFEFYFFPNSYRTLKKEGQGFENIINMGWAPMSWINRFITVPVFDFLDGFHLSYGLVILILTLLLKAAMFPLTYKSYVSMAKMRVLKPELDEIKAKVGADNAMLLQQEQMKLYKKAGVNPLGGCLPLLLQMPFTIAFFTFFPNLFELRGEGFLWVKDLSTYDSPIEFPALMFGFNHISLMCVLMTLTTLLTTWYNNATSGATGQMKYIGLIMPLFFFFVLNNFPAGLNYYYFLSAVMTFLTQVTIRSFINDDIILARIEENKKKTPSKKKNSFQRKMEEMMRQQQAANQQKKK